MIRYERGLSHSYLVFVDDEKRGDQLSINMLRENEIEGLLPVKVSMADSIMELAYEISGYQNIKKQLENTKINHKQLMKLLERLRNLLENLEAYYLEPECLVLEPEYIYCNEDFADILFCYDITSEVSGKKGLESLADLMVNAVDFYDYKSVLYAYEFRQALKEENFSLSNTIEKLKTIGVLPEYKTEPEIPIVAEERMSFTNDRKETTEAVTIKEQNMEGKKTTEKEMSELSGLFEEENWEDEEPSGKLFNFSKKKKVRKDKNKKECDSTQLDLMEESFFHVGKVDSPNENRVYEPKRYEINSVNSVAENFVVENYPFLVGSLQHAVDGCISDPEISKFHARFDQNLGKVYLSDLNSVSGTYLNGEKLNGSVQKEIKSGDRIKFGRLDFVVT